MDQLHCFEVQNQLLAFYNESGEEWMRHVDNKYAQIPIFKIWLEKYYDQYMKEKNQPSLQVPRYQPDQEYDARALQEYRHDANIAKLKEIVTEFKAYYEFHKKVLDSYPQGASVSANWRLKTRQAMAKLRSFYEVSGKDWMLEVDSKYAKSPVFQSLLNKYYDQYINEPFVQVPTYRHDQEYDPKAVQEYAREHNLSKLKEIVTEFKHYYESLKEVLDSEPRRVLMR
jgi:hypothetical protein